MSKIVIIGLGPGDEGSLTKEAIEKMSNGNKLYLRTEKHPTVKFLRDKEIEYETYDYVYDRENSFDDVYSFITKDLVKKATEYGIINYCVPGHPLVAERTVSMLVDLKFKNEVEIEIIPGLSFIEPVILAVGHDPVKGLKIIDGLELGNQNVDINTDNIITQVYDNIVASEAKLYLSDIYGDDYEIYVIKSAGIKNEEKIVKIPLYELDRLDWIDYLTSVYVPKMNDLTRTSYNMYNLINIMERLRSKEGCPWDIKQTHKSLREYVIEEAYEVAEAIDTEDMDSLTEELGDLLLQVVFHSLLGKEDGYFNIWDVISGICEKLIFRHPHIFSDKKAENIEAATTSWNEMKAKAKGLSTYTEGLQEVPKALPALIRSYKIQQKAAEVGFDWKDISGAMSKLQEEMEEVLVEFNESNVDKLKEEIGDLLFASVNLCRFLDINPEDALNATVNKFIGRFDYIEKESKKQGNDLKSMNLEEMDILWEMAKIHKNKKND